MAVLALLALASVTIKDAQFPLRAGCSSDDSQIAELKRGEPVEIRFAINGDAGLCYKVSTPQGEGYLPASALSSNQEFEKARAAGAMLEIRRAIQVQAAGTNQPLVAAVRLLDADQPDEALRVLESALRSGAKDPQVLSLAGIAAYRGDRVQQAAWYWKESLELRPNAAVRQMYDKAARELAADQSAEKKFGSRFVLRYDGLAVSEDTARQMVGTLEEEYSRITSELGCRWGERIAVIVQSPADYRRASDAANWSAGLYDGRIRVALMDRNQVGRQTRRIFSHELTHACLASLGKWPLWLHEGLAQRMSGDTLSPAETRQLKTALRAGSMPRIERLSQDWMHLSDRHAAQAYGLALAAVETFYQDYAQLGIRNLLNNPDLLPQIVGHLNRKLAE